MEVKNLEKAFEFLGVEKQANRDLCAPVLRITVEKAREAMKIAKGETT